MTLKQLRFIEFSRCLFPEESSIVRTELHTFCDASEEAYAAVVYIRNVYATGRLIVRQVKGSTKLSPTKTLSVPKLELNAALLGARLARVIQTALTRTITERFFWTDSSTVRNWVRATAAFYQTFVSHRLGEIQTLTESSEWRFVPGKINPADAATRSQLDAEAIPYVWLDGPDFLRDTEESWPADLPWMTVTEEMRAVRAHHLTTEPPPFDWESVHLPAEDIPRFALLQGEHLDWLKCAQRECYPEEVNRLHNGKPIRTSSPLVPLTPFLGPDGLLRLGGRIGRTSLPHNALHPPLLSGRHPLANKIAEAFHLRLKHAGTELVLSHVRQHVWLIGGRETVKRTRRNCLRCRRHTAKPGVQLMGELPTFRVEIGYPPFTRTACDYFGPLETSNYRNRVNKRYGVLFTCLVTRAVYLDLASSLSADDFLLALRRFIGLYGKPCKMYSDNGTNFVAAERLLREEVEKLHAVEDVVQFVQLEAIDWQFQPAGTLHFGGAHEALVKTAKKALYAALETERGALRYPTDDVLRTVLYEVAGLLNSRPLYQASSDPLDSRALTPNDFLNRPALAGVPAGDFTAALPLEQYRYAQCALQLFWDRWKGPYLQSLATRQRWQHLQRNFVVGDLVLEHDPALGRGQWRMGRVDRVFPGTDGLVRAVDVEFAGKIYRRGIQKLCLLEESSFDQQRSDSGENVASG